jgi:ligand-binding SRPBCC domain-containing protein
MPGTFTLTTSLWLPLPRPAVFDFFADAANLERITPPLLKFRVLTPLPVEMRPGALIDYRIGLRGIPLNWSTEITAWAPPRLFVDTQLRGPYREWVHTHTFEEDDGGTTVRDQVRYRLRGPAALGPLLNKLFVQSDVTRIFEFRHAALEDALGVSGRGRAGRVRVTAT